MKIRQIAFLFLVLNFSTTFAKEKASPQLNFDQSQSILYDMGNLGKKGTMKKRPEMKGRENSLYDSYLSDDNGLAEIGVGSRFVTLTDLVFPPGKTSLVLKNGKYDGSGFCKITIRSPQNYPQILKKGAALSVSGVEKKYNIGELAHATLRWKDPNNVYSGCNEGRDSGYKHPDELYLVFAGTYSCTAHYFSKPPSVSVKFQIEIVKDILELQIGAPKRFNKKLEGIYI